MDLLEGLNSEQIEAVKTLEGPLLVHAGPGSGKTRVIVHRIAYMVLKAKIKPRHILAVTFSRKAAGEMQKRLEELLGETASLLTVSTIHSACLRILRREGVPGLGTSFEIYDDEEQNKLIKQCMEKAGLSIEENDLRKFKGIISYAKINMINPDSIVPGSGGRFDNASAAVYRSYQQALKKQWALDYDDMLISTHGLLKENEPVLKKYQQLYRYILVDEFQDTSSLQYQIIKLLALGHRNVCVVGDPDQTIYSWRQAEIRNIDHFRKDFPGTRVIGMDENYRSTRAIVDAANALIAHNSRRKEKELTTSREEGKKVAVVRLEDEDGEARFIARTIKTVAAQSGLKNSDFAVLYRVNAQSRALEDGFNVEGLPYKLATGTPFYKRREIMDMAAWLRVIRNPADDTALTRAMRLAGKGIGAQSMAALQSHAEKSGAHLFTVLEQAAAGALPSLPVRTQRSAAHFLTLVHDLQAEARHISLVTLMNRILERTAYLEHLKGEDDPEERWENVLELISLAGAYEHLNPIEALSSLLQKITVASDAAERGQGEEAVTFNTLHGSKGTEFPVVFIAGAEEGLLPHNKSLDDPERLEEERRLCYVGITRAMDAVYLTYSEKRRSYGEISYRVPSRFIREIPRHLVMESDLSAPGQVKPEK
ncbi:MAG: UvrD-helicase domain-containing protein [Dehalococcoidia bacterium]|jgi:DNA helicase-2/ATP-dependent DNA helicase PcrA